MRFVKKISDRGTLTIPSDVREALDLRDGDLVDVHILGIVGRRDAPAPARVHSQSASSQSASSLKPSLANASLETA